MSLLFVDVFPVPGPRSLLTVLLRSNGCHSVDYALQLCFISMPSSVLPNIRCGSAPSTCIVSSPSSSSSSYLIPCRSRHLSIPLSLSLLLSFSQILSPVRSSPRLLPNESGKCSIHYDRREAWRGPWRGREGGRGSGTRADRSARDLPLHLLRLWNLEKYFKSLITHQTCCLRFLAWRPRSPPLAYDDCLRASDVSHFPHSC